MSPNVGNFVHDLVEMAKAMETLPQVEAERDHLKQELESALSRVQARELAIIDYKQDIDDLNTKVRTVEAERDDAEIRFLELDEKASGAVHQAMDLRSLAESLIARLDPPKPEPIPEPVQPPIPEAVHSLEPQPQGQGEDHPTLSTGKVDGDIASPTPQPPASQDQSEVNPTNPVTEQATSAYSNDAETSDVGSIAEPKPSGSYTGKRYFDVSGYVSHLDWLEGGGTEENYNWRPVY